MDFTSFHTALLTMVVLERQELIDAGAIGATDHQAWMAFQNDPARWFLSAGDEASAAVWKAIWRRRPLVPWRSQGGALCPHLHTCGAGRL